MSGDYIFPEKEFDPVEPADPDELNRVIQQPANLIGAGLGAHNLNDGLKSSAMVVEPAAYHSLTHDNVAQATGIISGGTATPTRSPGANAFEVPSDFEWHILDGLTRTITSEGSDVLLIVGWAQFSCDTSPGSVRESRIQLGIRVDGALWPGSKTGHDRDGQTFGEPWKIPAAKTGMAGGTYSTRSKYFGFGEVSAVNQPTNALRTIVCVPVLPGSHTVEVVARRVFSPSTLLGDTDWLVTYNRQMAVLSLKGGSTSSFSPSLLAVPSLQDQDALSAAALMTDRLDVIKAEMNTLSESSVGRAALRHVHLPSKVLASEQVTTPAGASKTLFQNDWPGFGSSTFGGLGVGTNWYKALTANNGGAGWDQSVSYGTDILILANVEMSTFPGMANACLYYTNGGTDQAIAGTEVVVQRHPDPPPAWTDDYADLPMMWVLSSNGGGLNYSELGVAVSRTTGGTSSYHRASIQVIFLRK